MAIHYQDTLDKTFRALGDGTRRTMLSMLATQGECTAGELGEPFDSAQPTISKHIRVLEQAGLVSRRVEGRVHRFRLLARRMKETESWLSRHRELWQNSLDELGDLLEEMKEDPKG